MASESGVRFPGGKPSIDGSSNGRTPASGAGNEGSSPSRSAKFGKLSRTVLGYPAKVSVCNSMRFDSSVFRHVTDIKPDFSRLANRVYSECSHVYNRYMSELTNTLTTPEMTLEEKLLAIQEAMAEAKGDPQKEVSLLNSIVDPQDALNCEGCQ